MRTKCKYRRTRYKSTTDSLIATCENEKIYKYNLGSSSVIIESPLVCEDCKHYEEDTE